MDTTKKNKNEAFKGCLVGNEWTNKAIITTEYTRIEDLSINKSFKLLCLSFSFIKWNGCALVATFLNALWSYYIPGTLPDLTAAQLILLILKAELNHFFLGRFLSAYVFCLHLYICSPCSCSTLRSQKRILDSLELVLKDDKPRTSARTLSALKCWPISSVPTSLFIMLRNVWALQFCLL